MTKVSAGQPKHDLPFTVLFPFLFLSFAVAWGILAMYLLMTDTMVALFGEISGRHPLFILAVYSPAIAALIVVRAYGGASALARFLSRLLLWRAPAIWYAVLLLGLPAIYFAGAAVKGVPLASPVLSETLATVLAAMVFMLVLGPIEEFGWRGVALPLLQRCMAPIWAGVVLGLIWGVWHLPAFFLSGTPQSAWGFTPFLAGSIAVSVILTPFFNAARGSILVAMLFHFQLNNPLWPDAQPYDTWFFVAAALVIVWLNRDTMFYRDRAVTTVIPPPRA